jgi:hypothetical protein
VDGRQIPAKPLQPDFENAGYIRSYMVLYASTGKMHEDEGNTISRDEYVKGLWIGQFTCGDSFRRSSGRDHQRRAVCRI